MHTGENIQETVIVPIFLGRKQLVVIPIALLLVDLQHK
jgi:hypothetical protein